MLINVEFKGRSFELKIELPLEQRKFNNEGEKFQVLFEQFERMNKEVKRVN
jgi:hypothetical protein